VGFSSAAQKQNVTLRERPHSGFTYFSGVVVGKPLANNSKALPNSRQVAPPVAADEAPAILVPKK
jgi:hypothetical protein